MKTKHANISIYVPHIGCPHKCSFCNQNVITGQSFVPHANDVVDSCEKAISSGVDPQNTEIAFFGGSFTAIPKSYMLELLQAAYEYVKQGFKGIRISTRPDAITPEILSILKGYGVTAIELGAQSMDNEVLALNERGHTSQDVASASKLINEYGFSLGLQMMVGLYGSTADNDIETAKKLIALTPNEVRIYPTVVLKNTKLGELYQTGEYKIYSLEDSINICTKLLDMFEQNSIKVIKLGLHSSQDVEKDMLGGIYHPAFRELCESRRFRNEIERLIADEKTSSFTVKSTDISKAIGQNKCNLEYFKQKGIDIKIIPVEEQKQMILPFNSALK